MRKYFSKKINGFTLVELLVVIAIIGILSSLSVVSLNSARGRARDAQRYNDLRQLFTAMTLYYDTRTTTPQYPEMFDDTHKYV
ncbi:MAG: prepilin-type N-terminal cleavage/methylation domain-containing protein, partial [Patescibacteria group bacterium]